MVADAQAQLVQEEYSSKELHALFFPFLAHGHMIPLFDIARIFAAQDGVRVTIVTTPANASVFTEDFEQKGNSSLQGSNKSPQCNSEVNVEIIPFPSESVGLPAGVENSEHLTSDDEILKFLEACQILREPLEALIDRLKPSFIISDMIYTWTTDVANDFGIPRLVFHGSSFFSYSVAEVILKEKPYKGISSPEEEFVIPGLPDTITFTKMQMLPESFQDEGRSPMMEMMDRAIEAERKSFGLVMNSFYELEPKYADYYREVLGKRAWAIGPVSQWSSKCGDINAKSSRGKKATIDKQECLKWLDSKPSNSVVYVSFGSVVNISSAQLREIAVALEASNQNFIWVQKNKKRQAENKIEEDEDWLPYPEFKEKIKEKGLIIRGWAPQLLILDHQATGAFVTHCGWNSILEGVAAGVSMVTWPVFADQFLNEKLVTHVIKTGVPVGSKKYWNPMVKEIRIEADAIKNAIERVTDGEEAREIRKRAEVMKEKARVAVQRGGSSHQSLIDLLHKLQSY